MNIKTSTNLEKILDLCAEMDQQIGLKEEDSIRTSYLTDCTHFLLFLAKLDGVISLKESDFIQESLKIDYPFSVLEAMADCNFFQKEAISVPPSIQKILVVDRVSGKQSFSTVLHSVSELAMYVMIRLAKDFLDECGDASGEGRKYLDDLRKAMQGFLKADTKIRDQISIAKMGEELSTDAWMEEIEPQIFREGENTVKQEKQDEAEAEEPEDPRTLEELLEELNSLVGLEDVKKDVNSLTNMIRIRSMREERGLKELPLSLHLVFSGNPGTGKTTVARLLAKIYHKTGVLSKGQLVEVDRSGLVGGYVGQTALKVQEVVKKALGGVLFIDEAYALTAKRGETDYGQEAVDTLLKAMEDHRKDLVVIVAGYPDLMNEFLQSNPGLQSRFNKFFYFEDYTADELTKIFESMCKKAGYTVSEAVREKVLAFFENRCAHKDENFANARDVRNYFEKAMVNQADRLAKDDDITDEELLALDVADVENIQLNDWK